MRIQLAKNAAHTFEAYTSFASILKNQKRQMIGQTLVHILVDDYLRKLSPIKRSRFADTIRRLEQENPNWLKELLENHLRHVRFCWQLYPGLLSHRFTRLGRLNLVRRILCFPTALVGFGISLMSSFAASKFLRSGETNYWPRAQRSGLGEFPAGPATSGS